MNARKSLKKPSKFYFLVFVGKHTKHSKVPKMLMTTNPTTNWVRGRFVQDENGDKVTTREGEFYVPFSVFDNPDIAFRQTYEAALNKISDQATKERLLYGNWDFVEANDMALYNQFDGTKHLITGLKEKLYDPTKPMIVVWDFNVAPLYVYSVGSD